jgi:predicted RNA methylase
MKDLIEQLSEIRDVIKRRQYLEKKGMDKTQIELLLEQVHIKNKSKEKFPRAELMKFTSESLSQSSSMQVSEYRTWKMRNQLGTIKNALDICAGVGGDTIAMALRWNVIAVEKDKQIMDMLKHNCSVYNVQKKINFVQEDINELLLNQEFIQTIKDSDVIFFDPSRRKDGKRTVKMEEYEPSLLLIKEFKKYNKNICVKISPGTDLSRIKYDCDTEVVSYKGEVKDIILWFGALKKDENIRTIMATKLPERITIEKNEKEVDIKLERPLQYIYEPDPAFIKAKLITEIAEKHNLKKMSKNSIYLTSNNKINNSILKSYKVIETTNIDYTKINQILENHSIGKVDFKSKIVDIDNKNLHKKIKGKGKNKGLVIFTKVMEKPSAIICLYS